MSRTFFFCFIFSISGVFLRNIPKLSDISPKKYQNFGSKLKISCFVEEGSKPFRFEWHKDDQILVGTNSHYNIETDEEESQLIISKLNLHDSGNYSCSAWNEFGTDTMSTFLTVQGLIL